MVSWLCYDVMLLYDFMLVTFFLIGHLMSIWILALKTESYMFQKSGVLECRIFLNSGM